MLFPTACGTGTRRVNEAIPQSIYSSVPSYSMDKQPSQVTSHRLCRRYSLHRLSRARIRGRSKASENNG